MPLSRPPSWFSPRMTERHLSVLQSLHPLLVRLLDLSLPPNLPDLDWFPYCTSGHRTLSEQDYLHKKGVGTAPGRSWHNLRPSLAVDLVPVFSDSPTEIEWAGAKVRHRLQDLALSSARLLTWGPVLRPGDIYHFQPITIPKTPPPGFLQGYTLAPSSLPETREEAEDFVQSLTLRAGTD